MVHARLGIGRKFRKLVTLVRQEARKVAEAKKLDLILTDGPPGIGCPVIASLGGATAALIVTEPTVAGRHDMERVAQLADFFRVPVLVCVNKADLNLDSRDVRHYRAEGYAFWAPSHSTRFSPRRWWPDGRSSSTTIIPRLAERCGKSGTR
jgi:MinD superfamily P-loop ATPase